MQNGLEQWSLFSPYLQMVQCGSDTVKTYFLFRGFSDIVVKNKLKSKQKFFSTFKLLLEKYSTIS